MINNDVTRTERTTEGRNELIQYQTWIKRVEAYSLRILELKTKINKVASGSPKKLPEGNDNQDDWRSPLFEEIEILEKRLIMYETRIDIIHDFVLGLEMNDRMLIDKLFLRNRKQTYKQLHNEYKYTESGLRDYVNSLIQKHW